MKICGWIVKGRGGEVIIGFAGRHSLSRLMLVLGLVTPFMRSQCARMQTLTVHFKILRGEASSLRACGSQGSVAIHASQPPGSKLALALLPNPRADTSFEYRSAPKSC